MDTFCRCYKRCDRERLVTREVVPRPLAHSSAKTRRATWPGCVSRRLQHVPAWVGQRGLFLCGMGSDVGALARVGGSRIRCRLKPKRLRRLEEAGPLLRLETAVHDPRAFRVRERVLREGRSRSEWVPLRKGAAHLRAISAPSSTATPGRGTRKSHPASPSRSSGMPITATHAVTGCGAVRASISTGPQLTPPAPGGDTNVVQGQRPAARTTGSGA
jgi:hypothetical protein